LAGNTRWRVKRGVKQTPDQDNLSLRLCLFEVIQIDTLDFQCSSCPLSNIETDHWLRQRIAIDKDETKRSRLGRRISGGLSEGRRRNKYSFLGPLPDQRPYEALDGGRPDSISRLVFLRLQVYAVAD
jgi:hypothetical protein